MSQDAEPLDGIKSVDVFVYTDEFGGAGESAVFEGVGDEGVGDSLGGDIKWWD